MAKTAAQAAAKWATNTQGAEDAWAEGLSTTTKDIVGLATSANAQAKATQNYNAAWTSGRLQAALQKVGNQGIKTAALAKKTNYTTGVTEAVPRMTTFLNKLIPYIQAGLPAIEQMPTATRAQAKAKQNAWLDYMADGKGQFTT